MLACMLLGHLPTATLGSKVVLQQLVLHIACRGRLCFSDHGEAVSHCHCTGMASEQLEQVVLHTACRGGLCFSDHGEAVSHCHCAGVASELLEQLYLPRWALFLRSWRGSVRLSLCRHGFRAVTPISTCRTGAVTPQDRHF